MYAFISKDIMDECFYLEGHEYIMQIFEIYLERHEYIMQDIFDRAFPRESDLKVPPNGCCNNLIISLHHEDTIFSFILLSYS